MLKRIALLLLTVLCLAGVAYCEAFVTAELPADTADITSFALDSGFSAEKTGYQTVGWYVTAPSGDAFDTFIGKYRDSLAAQGFTLTREVHPSGLDAVYYFFDHPDSRLTSARMNGIDFDLFLCGEKNGSRMAMVLGVVPGINLTEPAPEESWESLFGEEEPTWESVLDIPQEEPAPTIDPSAKNVIPSFESFAREAILSVQTNGGRTTCTVSMEDFSALIEYMMVLELNYGVSGQDETEENLGLPMYLFLEEYEGELDPDSCTIMLGIGEKIVVDGYVFFALDEKDGLISVTVWYAQGMTPADTGDRWSGSVLEGEYLASIAQMFTQLRNANQIYPFKNDAIAKDMAFKLKKDVGEITWTDVWNYNDLGVIMPTNPDLSDVENMSLFRFSIYPMTSETIDLSCLKNSEYLDVLNLSDGRYTGFDTVAKLEWIDQISLYAKSISEISWMKDMELLRFVSIQDCSVTDFSALGTLPRLKQVYLEISLSSDVSFLYGKGLTFGKTFGSPDSTFDEWYEKSWGVPGQAATATARPASSTATPRPSSGGERCSTCGGDGYRDVSCSTCGGDGDVERSCANCGGDGDRDCMSCAGKGYDNCSGCYGSGNRRCGSCYGTGKNGDRRCSTCSGRGEKTCSSCGGSGRKRCSACSGSGDRSCTNCGGDGRREQSCTSCGGDGRDTRLCTSCGGDGVR